MKRRFVRSLAAAAIASLALFATTGRLFTAEPNGDAKKPPEQSAPLGKAADSSHAGNTAIEAALAEPVKLEFNGVSLKEVADELHLKHHVDLKFDWHALKDASIDPGELTVKASYEGISLRSALMLLLRAHDLSWVVEDDVLLITTGVKADSTLHPRAYDVRDLLSVDEDGKADYDSLVGLIKSIVAPIDWDDVGGPGSLSPVEPGCLIISQSDEVHRQIAGLLAAMRQVREQIKNGKFESAVAVNLNAANKAIEKALLEKADFEFTDTPLDEALASIRRKQHLEIQVDSKALSAAGIDPATLTISESIHGLPLRSALNQLLRQHNLTWIIADETLLITTKEAAESAPYALEIRLYPICDLMADSDEPADPSTHIIDAIKTTVGQSTWSSAGGQGEIQPYGDGKNLTLGVLQNREVHEQISDLLAQLRDVYRKQHEVASHLPVKPKEPEEMAVRVYDLRINSPGTPAMSPQETAEIVKALVEPKSWLRGDAYIRGATGKLIVRQLPSIHREIEKLLLHLDVLPLKEPAGPREKSLLGRGLGASGGGF